MRISLANHIYTLFDLNIKEARNHTRTTLGGLRSIDLRCFGRLGSCMGWGTSIGACRGSRRSRCALAISIVKGIWDCVGYLHAAARHKDLRY
jgi:hypothetical protein